MSHSEQRRQAFAEVAGAAYDSLALLAMLEIGVFDALRSGPATLAQLAERTKTSAARLRPMLDRVGAVGFLLKKHGHYQLVPGDEPLFDPNHVHALQLSDVHPTFTRMARAVDVLRTDRKIDVAGTGAEATAEDRHRFLHYLHTRSIDGANEVAELLTRTTVSRLLDVGCGLGTYTAAILRRAPEARAELMDRPTAAPSVDAFLRDEGLADRATFRPGDFTRDPWGSGFDLVLISNVVHLVGEAGTRRLLDQTAAALAPGGRIAIKDTAIDTDGYHPTSAGRFGVLMSMVTDGGGVFGAPEVGGWLEQSGFTVVEEHELVRATGAYMLVARLDRRA